MTELSAYFANILAAIPDTQHSEPQFYRFCAETVQVPAEALTTSDLCATIRYHHYDNFPMPAVVIEADKDTLGALGILIFASMFGQCKGPLVVLLRHPRTKIRKICVGNSYSSSESLPGLCSVPTHFNYYPDVPDKHPWFPYYQDGLGLPHIGLGDDSDAFPSDPDVRSRDVLFGFGSSEGSSKLAELLLNASRPSNTQLEFELECDAGFRGVAPTSVELQIHLPGSIGNLDHEPTNV